MQFNTAFEGSFKSSNQNTAPKLDVSLNGGTPKSSILIGFSI